MSLILRYLLGLYYCRLHCVIHLCCIILTLMLYYCSTYVIMPRMLRYLLACVVLFSLISHVALSVLLVTHAVISNWYSCMLCAIPCVCERTCPLCASLCLCHCPRVCARLPHLTSLHITPPHLTPLHLTHLTSLCARLPPCVCARTYPLT